MDQMSRGMDRMMSSQFGRMPRGGDRIGFGGFGGLDGGFGDLTPSSGSGTSYSISTHHIASSGANGQKFQYSSSSRASKQGANAPVGTHVRNRRHQPGSIASAHTSDETRIPIVVILLNFAQLPLARVTETQRHYKDSNGFEKIGVSRTVGD
eukprot:3200819-Pyramimonas_sp.AAC.1